MNEQDLSTGMEEVMRQADRRTWLCKHPPVGCPKCGADQIQLTDSFSVPAGWKCRECKHAFSYEFRGNVHPRRLP